MGHWARAEQHCLNQPDDKNHLGLMLNDEKYFERMLQKAIAMNFQVCTHAIGSAYANKEEKDKGSIAVGKDADFVILSDDIMTCNEKNIPTVKVKFTYVNGERVYQEK